MIRRILRPRVLVYVSILVLILGLFATSVAIRNPFRVDVVRDRASLARIVDDGKVENVYRLQIMNNAEVPQRYRVRVQGLPGIALGDSKEILVGPAEARWVTIGVQIPFESAKGAGSGAHPIQFEIERLAADAANPGVKLSEKSTFMVPR